MARAEKMLHISEITYLLSVISMANWQFIIPYICDTSERGIQTGALIAVPSVFLNFIVCYLNKSNCLRSR